MILRPKFPLAPILKKDYRIIETVQDARSCIEAILKAPDVVAVDTESTGKEPMTAKVIGISVSTKIGNGWYLALHKWEPILAKLEPIFENSMRIKILEDFFDALSQKPLIMFNAPYDIPILWSNFGVDFTWCLHSDVIMMKHTLDENPPHGLKPCATKYSREIGIPYDEVANQEQVDLKESIKANGGKISKEEYELYKADYKKIGLYACADTDYTLRLYYLFQDRLEKTSRLDFFYKKEVMPLMKFATLTMKMRGIFVDVAYFENLLLQYEADEKARETEIYSIWEEEAAIYERTVISKSVNVRRTGDFALAGMEYFNLPTPINAKTNTPTMAKPALLKLANTYSSAYLDWLLWDPKKSLMEEPQLDSKAIYEIKAIVYKRKNTDAAFSISSPAHIAWLLFEHFKASIDPSKVSKKTEKPSVDEDVLAANAHIKGMTELLAYRKVGKQLSTFIRPILAKHINGWIHPDMLQFGTNSGRYSSGGGLNLQTLPRDDKRIKKGFVAPPGYMIVSSDYSSLEPRVFSWVCGDVGLKEIFQKGLDFYSKIAIDVYKLDGLSANEKDPNFLKKLKPELRQSTKGFALAVPYGANAFKLSMETGRPIVEHQAEIDSYLESYPDLQKYMRDQEQSAARDGYVKTQFGRIRHLPKAKELYSTYGKDIFNKFKMALKFAGPDGAELYEEYLQVRDELKSPDFDFLEKEELSSILRTEHKDLLDRSGKLRKKIEKLGKEGIYQYGIFRNCMNNAKNSPIQMTAAHVANAAAIKFGSKLLEEELDAWMCLQVHDELIAIAREDQAERVKELMQDAMCNNWVTRRIDMPILAEPTICNSLAEAK